MSVVTGFEGVNWSPDALGGLFGAGAPPSGTVIVVIPQASPLVALLPFAVRPARSNWTEPEPADGAVQSTLQLL